MRGLVTLQMIQISLELLAKKMNQDLKILSQWLKANRLSLNVKKIELIIFHPKMTKQI